MIYFIRTRQVTEICYAVEAENLSPEEFLEHIRSNPLSKFDFSQRTLDEEIDTFGPITKEMYLDIFDRTYPQFKSINNAQKLYNIREFPGDEVVNYEVFNEKDEL